MILKSWVWRAKAWMKAGELMDADPKMMTWNQVVKVRAKGVWLKIFEMWAHSLLVLGLYFPTQFYLVYDFQLNIPQCIAFILLFDSSGSPSSVSLNQHSRSLIIWSPELLSTMVSLNLFTNPTSCTLASYWPLSIARLFHLHVYLELHAFLTCRVLLPFLYVSETPVSFKLHISMESHYYFELSMLPSP